MDHSFEILKKGREIILKVADTLTISQLNTTPKGFNNNIAWNIAHLVVTQQMLCYGLSELPFLISKAFIEKYKKGTAPAFQMEEDELKEIKKMLITLPLQLEKDYNSGVFKTFSTYTTSANVTLDSIEDAVQFNNFHEGIHLGVILGLKKMV